MLWWKQFHVFWSWSAKENSPVRVRNPWNGQINAYSRLGVKHFIMSTGKNLTSRCPSSFNNTVSKPLRLKEFKQNGIRKKETTSNLIRNKNVFSLLLASEHRVKAWWCSHHPMLVGFIGVHAGFALCLSTELEDVPRKWQCSFTQDTMNQQLHWQGLADFSPRERVEMFEDISTVIRLNIVSLFITLRTADYPQWGNFDPLNCSACEPRY